jgi:hypothetical protein
MRKRLLIVAGVIALAGVLVLLIPGKQSSITVQVINKTMINKRGRYECVIRASNNVDNLSLYLYAWTEYSTNGERSWNELPGSRLQGPMRPHKFADFKLPVFLNGGKARVAFTYKSDNNKPSAGRLRLQRARTMIGLKPWPEAEFHVEVE